MKSFVATLKVCIAALLTTLVTALVAHMAEPGFFSFTHDGKRHMFEVVIAPALLAALHRLMKSPFFEGDGDIKASEERQQPWGRAAIAGGLLAACIFVLGCGGRVASPAPATAASFYQNAAQTMHDFSADVVAAERTEISVYQAGLISKDAHRAFQQGMKPVSTYGPKIDKLIADQAASTTIQAQVQAALAAVQSVVGTASLSATGNTAEVFGKVNLIVTLLQNVLNSLNFPNLTEVVIDPGTDRRTRSGSSAGNSAWLQHLQPGQRRSRSYWHYAAADQRSARGSRRQLRYPAAALRCRAGEARLA